MNAKTWTKTVITTAVAATLIGGAAVPAEAGTDTIDGGTAAAPGGRVYQIDDLVAMRKERMARDYVKYAAARPGWPNHQSVLRRVPEPQQSVGRGRIGAVVLDRNSNCMGLGERAANPQVRMHQGIDCISHNGRALVHLTRLPSSGVFRARRSGLARPCRGQCADLPMRGLGPCPCRPRRANASSMCGQDTAVPPRLA